MARLKGTVILLVIAVTIAACDEYRGLYEPLEVEPVFSSPLVVEPVFEPVGCDGVNPPPECW
jgi:hypothetical protein